jgi:hypothetical protein
VASKETRSIGWFPLRGSWEESVLSWNEQIDIAVRRRRTSPAFLSRTKSKVLPNGLEAVEEDQAASVVS